MEHQRNDRLGRNWQQQLFEHRRQVLPDCADSDAHAYRNRNSYSYADAYSNSHSHTDAYTDCNSDSYTYGNSNTYRDSNANRYTDTDSMQWEMRTHAEAAPDSGAAPVACNVSWKR